MLLGVVPGVRVRLGVDGRVDVRQRQLLAVQQACLEGVVALDDVDVVSGDVGERIDDLGVQLVLKVAHAHRFVDVPQFTLDLVVLEQCVEDIGDDQAVVGVLAKVLFHGPCTQTRVGALPQCPDLLAIHDLALAVHGDFVLERTRELLVDSLHSQLARQVALAEKHLFLLAEEVLSPLAHEQQVVAVVVQLLVGDQACKDLLVHLAQFDGKEDECIGDVAAEFLHLHHQALRTLIQVICREHEFCVLGKAPSGGTDALFFNHELPEFGRSDTAGRYLATVLDCESCCVTAYGLRVAFDLRIVKARVQGAQVPYHVLRPQSR